MAGRIVFLVLTALLMAGIPVSAAASAVESSATVESQCYYEVRMSTPVHQSPNGPVVFVTRQTVIARSFDERDLEWVGLVFPSPTTGDFPQTGYVARELVRLFRCV